MSCAIGRPCVSCLVCARTVKKQFTRANGSKTPLPRMLPHFAPFLTLYRASRKVSRQYSVRTFIFLHRTPQNIITKGLSDVLLHAMAIAHWFFDFAHQSLSSFTMCSSLPPEPLPPPSSPPAGTGSLVHIAAELFEGDLVVVVRVGLVEELGHDLGPRGAGHA